MHDDVVNAVEAPGAQASPNFYEYAQRTMFTDGSNMLQTMNARNLLQKVSTSNIMMTPNQTSQVKLSELNDIIREQSGGAPVVAPELMAEADMQGKDTSPVVTEAVEAEQASAPAPTVAPADGVMGDEDVAKGMISQAEYFEGEAKRLREEAYALDDNLRPKRGRPKKETAEA
ncbi:MAG: hypothetical protein CBE00_08355 [Planctomycetaceae bacterium TMED240]|nr:MAG: hypothetical protein CBE00_08355 [Planctomycetaceae bacterium TMED240]